MTKQNLTQYGEGELLMWVMNDETLYNAFNRSVRLQDFSYLRELLDNLFVYTPYQLEEVEIEFNTEMWNKEAEVETV